MAIFIVRIPSDVMDNTDPLYLQSAARLLRNQLLNEDNPVLVIPSEKDWKYEVKGEGEITEVEIHVNEREE